MLSGCRKILARKPKLAIELHLDVLGKYGSSIEQLWELIDVDAYRGDISIRQGDRNKLVEFDKNLVPAEGIASVFLEPKH